MNAHFFPRRHTRRRLSDADLERLVDHVLDDDCQRDVVFDSHRNSDLERFLHRLGRKRRRHLLRRWLPHMPAFSWPRHPRAATVRQEAVAARSLPSTRWRLSLLLAGVLLLPKLAIGLVAEPLSTPLLARAENEMADQAKAAMRCSDSVILRDGTGTALGILPVYAGEACRQTRTHLTAPFDTDTALRIAEAIGVVEGRWERGLLTFLGQDIVGLTRGAAFEAERWLRGLTRREALNLWLQGEKPTWLPPRGSGPMLSAFEALVGQASQVEGIKAKLANIRAAAVFVAAELRDGRQARAHFLAERMTVVHGPLNPLAGAAAAEALFDGPPRTLGQICLFAAASSFHLYQDLPAYGEMVAWRHERAQRRAGVCADQLADSDAERLAARAYIDAFENPKRLLPVLPASTSMIARDALIAASVNHPSSDTRLLLDLDAQQRAEAAFQGMLPELSARLEPGLCLSGSCEVPVDYLVAVAEITDDQLPLRVALTNRHRSLLGPFERMPDGTTRPLPAAFGLGSQHKVLLALVADRNGENRLCNRISGDITNTSGPVPVAECVEGRSEGWVDIDTAFEVSMNLPWIDVARRHLLETETLETQLGFLGDPAGPGGAAMGVGLRAPPERFMALFAALARGKLGQPARTDGLMLLEGYPVFPIDLEELGYGHTLAGDTSSIFAAPLASQGTLRQLSERLAGVGCVAVMGKTGTTEIDGGGRARSRSATVVVRCGSRSLVVFAGVESSNGSRALGAISARDLERMTAGVLEALLEKE